MRTGRPKENLALNLNTSYQALIEHYAQWLQTLGFSKSIVYGYPKSIYYFLQFLEQKSIHKIHLITQKTINDYIVHLQSRENLRKRGALSIAHLNKSFDALDKFIEFLNQHSKNTTIIPTNYRISIDKTEYIQSIKYLSKEEIKQLYESVPNLFRRMSFKDREPRHALATLILDLCYGCGLRKSEAYNLEINDIDFDKKLIFIQQGKGYKDRYIPINETIYNRLKLFIYQHRRCFKTNHKRAFPFDKGTMVHYFKSMREIAEINPNAGLHSLRHSIATHLLQNGMKIEQISKFLGHSSLDSTQIYTHLISAN
jgi:integrase/recombinase XerD